MSSNRLIADIENCRKTLNQKAKFYPLTDEKVLHISDRLDKLLNRYQSFQ